jgi:hypothetical protein
MARAAKKKAARKLTPKAADSQIAEKRARAYSDMEPHLCDLVSMGKIAMDQFDKDKGLFVFAVGKLEEMLNDLKARCYALDFSL